jgi:hypothetical protein
MSATLEITDGTDTVSLIQDGGNTFFLNEWMPRIVLPKAGGVYQQSALSDGRRLVDRKFDTVAESFDMKGHAESMDAMARELQVLRALLEKAVAYWTTDWQSTPVYFVCQAECETNARYALIMNYSTPDDENPFSQPWLAAEGTVLDNWTLTIERDHWTENAPGTGTATAASAVEAYNGRNFGNIDSAGARDPVTTQDVYVVNKRNEANLTHVYEDDGGVFSANLLDAALPHRLLPAVPTTSDDMYFGIDTSVSDSGPFDNLVFDVGTAQTNITDTDWLYWNGAWAAFATVRDYTASAIGSGVAFSRTGVYSVRWEIPSDWATTSVNGVTAYWVRLNIGTVDPGPAGATQQNRRIYSATWPYAEIQAAAVGGTLPALLRILAQQREDTQTGAIKRIFCGLRSQSRGSNFTAVLNASDEQNPTGIAVSAGANSSFINLVPSPTGRVIEYNPSGADSIAVRAQFQLATSISPEYVGSFHAFFRYITTGATTSYTANLSVRSDQNNITTFTGETVTIAAGATTDLGIADLGKVDLPPYLEHADADESGRVHLRINVGSSDGTDNLRIVDLWLMPIDEWAADMDQDETSSSSAPIRLDSLQNPRRVLRAGVFNSSDQIIQPFKVVKNGPAILQASSQQRLWFLLFRFDVSDREESNLYHSVRVQLQSNQRYFSTEGINETIDINCIFICCVYDLCGTD